MADDPDRRPPRLVVPPGAGPPPGKRPESWAEMAERKRRGRVARARRQELAEALGLEVPAEPGEE